MQIAKVHLQPFRRNLLLKCVPQPEIATKITKTLILGVQGHLKLSTLTPIKRLSLLLVIVMISSMSVPICNRFHATRDNCAKITTFRGVAVFDARLRRPL